MAWPYSVLPVAFELYLSGAWVDVTTYVRRASRITITRGRGENQSTTPPARCRLTLDNTDGRFSPRNPLGPYYGQLGRNTPARVRVNPGSGYLTRIVGAVASWPTTWDTSGVTVWCAIEIAGPMRQLEQGSALLPSALRQGVVDDAALAGGVTYYWPLEDGADAGSALPEPATSAPAMHPFGSTAPRFAQVDGPPGSDRLPDFSSKGSLSAIVPWEAPDTGSWQFEVWFKTQPGDSTSYTACVPIQVDFVGGNIPAFDTILFIGEGAGGQGVGTLKFDIAIYEASPPSETFRAIDLAIITTAYYPEQPGTWHLLQVALVQQSPGVVRLDAVLDGSITLGSVTDSSWTLGRPSRITVNPCQDAPGADAYAGVDGVGIASLGHVTVKNFVSYGITHPAGLGWAGEIVGARIDRLCAQEGVPVDTIASPQQKMGPQRRDTLLRSLRECEAVDAGGFLYESRDVAQLAWRPRSDLYNQAPALTLTYTSPGHLAPPLPVVDDDLHTRNDVSVTRRGGGTRRYELTTGPLSTQDPPDGVGRYDETLSLDCYTDDQAEQIAAWRVHLGTVDQPRIPVVSVNLLALACSPSAALVDDTLAVDIGDRIDLANLPPWVPAAASMLTTGYTETIDEMEWSIDFTTVPADPYRVAVLNDTSYGRLDSEHTTLRNAITAGATSIVTRTALRKAKWTTNGALMPIPMVVGGEEVSVTAIANLAPSFVGAGTAAAADNASVAPTLPGGVAEYDLILILASIRNSGTGVPVPPAGYFTLIDAGNVKVFYKMASAAESTPTVTFTGGAASATTLAHAAVFRGVWAGDIVGAASALNGSAQDIAVPVLDFDPVTSGLLIQFGWKQDDWTSVAPTASGTEIGEPSSVLGSDAGITWAYRIIGATAPFHQIPAATFTVTGGVSAISRGLVLFLGDHLQTMTVTRSVNGISKLHLAETPIRLAPHARTAIAL